MNDKQTSRQLDKNKQQQKHGKQAIKWRYIQDKNVKQRYIFFMK